MVVAQNDPGSNPVTVNFNGVKFTYNRFKWPTLAIFKRQISENYLNG